MEKLNEILAAYVAKGNDTKDKLLGAAFTVVSRDGESGPDEHRAHHEAACTSMKLYTEVHMQLHQARRSTTAQPAGLIFLWTQSLGARILSVGLPP